MPPSTADIWHSTSGERTLWLETVTGHAWTPDGSPTFEDALNAFVRLVLLRGGALAETIQYQAFMGPEGMVVHSAFVQYEAHQRVPYSDAIEWLEATKADAEAAIGFVYEDSHAILADAIEEDDDDES